MANTPLYRGPAPEEEQVRQRMDRELESACSWIYKIGEIYQNHFPNTHPESPVNLPVYYYYDYFRYLLTGKSHNDLSWDDYTEEFAKAKSEKVKEYSMTVTPTKLEAFKRVVEKCREINEQVEQVIAKWQQGDEEKMRKFIEKEEDYDDPLIDVISEQIPLMLEQDGVVEEGKGEKALYCVVYC